MGPGPGALGQRSRANPASHPGSVHRPGIDDVEPRIDPTGGCVRPPCRGRGGFQPSLDRSDARLDHRSVPGACRGLVADEMDHWSGDCRQGRAPAGARVAALGSSRHRSRREGCLSSMSDRCGCGARRGHERRRVAPLSCTAAELDSALRRGGGGGLRSGHTPAQRRQPAEPPRVCRSRGWRPAAAGGGGSAFGARRGHRRRVRDREALLELHGYAGKERSLCS